MRWFKKDNGPQPTGEVVLYRRAADLSGRVLDVDWCTSQVYAFGGRKWFSRHGDNSRFLIDMADAGDYEVMTADGAHYTPTGVTRADVETQLREHKP